MKIIKLFLTFLLTISSFSVVFADEDVYVVKDNATGFAEEFNSYWTASNFYNSSLNEYDNLILVENGKVIDMEYGIVKFLKDKDAISYHSTIRNDEDYIFSGYGVDGAYLFNTNNNIYFVAAGDRGYTNIDNVELIPIEEIQFSLSKYCTDDKYLYHNIKTQLEYEYITSSLMIDFIPLFLNPNSSYYSYDCHYFYDNFNLMIDDYRNEVYDNAINTDKYFNYFQFLPHHSFTNYTCNDLEDFFYRTLGINGRLNKYIDFNNDGASDQINRSELYDNVNIFFNAQGIYGTNALMLISSAILESSYGRNLNAYLNNNLYTNTAYDSEYEKDNNRYNSIENSIYAHAKYYISGLYSNIYKPTYHGTNFGNKISGINIEHSLDQHYGEKAASEFFKLDLALDNKDYNALAIGIVDREDITLYSDSELSNKITTINNKGELSFVILDECESSYKVQIDLYNNNEYLYNFKDAIAYVNKESFSYILNKDCIHEYDIKDVYFDFVDGEVLGYNKLTLSTINEIKPFDVIPKKDGYEFNNYTIIDDGSKDIYTADYKEIKNISLYTLMEKQKDLLPYPDLSNGMLYIAYKNGGNKILSINSDMISKYDFKNFEAQDINISYSGFNIEKTIQIDSSYYEEYEKLDNSIKNNEYEYIKENIDIVKYPYTMNQIRTIDYNLKNENKRNYIISDKTNSKYNISISGLDLSLDDRRNFSLIDDTYYVTINDIDSKNKNKILNVAEGYGFTDVTGLNIKFNFNYQKVNLRGPAIVQIDIKDKTDGNIYTVYHVDENGDVIKCRTTQSENYIQFVIREKGDYLVLSKPGFNAYNISDIEEAVNYSNLGFDNNRMNIEFMIGLASILFALVGILIYYSLTHAKERDWKDYKKSLLKADTVQEEKQKN